MPPVLGSASAPVILTIVSSDPAFQNDVRTMLEARYRFEAVWTLGYSDAARLHALKSDQHCLNIVDFSTPIRALPFARSLGGRSQIITIAVGCGNSRQEVLLLMQAGIRDVVADFTARDLLQSVDRAVAVMGASGDLIADLFAFVPAKPGCGASTVATHAAGMAAELAGEPTLLLDFDIRLGVTTFLLKAEGTRTLVDALRQVDRLDRDMWSNVVAQIGNLHLLGSGASDLALSYSAEHFQALLDFAVRQYSVVAVDLPGTMEDYECDALLRAKGILLVCTPDIGALHVARRKSQWLQDLHLTEKVSVVLNNVQNRLMLPVKDIENIIHLPVRYLLPPATKDVAKAIDKGRILDQNCSLGRQIAAIAADMVPAKSAVTKPSPVRRFVEYFSVSPARGTGSA